MLIRFQFQVPEIRFLQSYIRFVQKYLNMYANQICSEINLLSVFKVRVDNLNQCNSDLFWITRQPARVTTSKQITVLRSAHIYKKAKEKFI